MNDQPTVDCLLVGPLLGPVHGATVATRSLAATLRAHGLRLTEIDYSGPPRQRLAALRRALSWIHTSRTPLVYLSVNGNWGLIATLLLAWRARRSGKSLILHHHSFRYIAEFDPLLLLLSRAAGKDALHIVNCPHMGTLLQRRYPALARVCSLSNVGSVSPELRPSGARSGPLAIGHMSNLTQEKGIGRVVEAMERLLSAGIDARLEVAGPASDAFAEKMIAHARILFGERFRYHGPVYGADKAAFFDAIDVFAFPSLYPTETQGIVNLEAMACGKPVVAFAQCCIGPDIGKLGGLAVEKGDDYPAQFVAFCRRFLPNRQAMSRDARRRFEQLTEAYTAEIAYIVDFAKQKADHA